MFFHPILAAITSLMNTLYSTLPDWHFLGFGANPDAASDKGALYWFLSFLKVLDRFVPVNDALVPIVLISFGITAGLLTVKTVKFVLSLIPTISAGG